jgi:hypothetical protein
MGRGELGEGGGARREDWGGGRRKEGKEGTGARQRGEVGRVEEGKGRGEKAGSSAQYIIIQCKSIRAISCGSLYSIPWLPAAM